MGRKTFIRTPATGRKRQHKERRLRPAYVAALLVISLACFSTGAAQHALSPPQTVHEGVVTRVVDGDTLYIKGLETRIRLWGLDAPERGKKGGYRATRMLREIAHGRHLSCREVDIDRYGRIVAQCFRPDGRDAAALMIESGAAKEYLRYSGGYYSRTAMAGGD
ncbi:thermonuclease family protein [Hyphococcus luteus]|uniref:TNase-like domain-containing protein n=1 Tax=Hyphococcus luteus TaxID=2058213 RepID=A0A2S7K8R7_9PROT|nr:thermonuclease family protein [Marinicaulis flavus]PQA88896.1 hypothetical protein CW354_02755 [Marinicaulis flavus]